MHVIFQANRETRLCCIDISYMFIAVLLTRLSPGVCKSLVHNNGLECNGDDDGDGDIPSTA